LTVSHHHNEIGLEGLKRVHRPPQRGRGEDRNALGVGIAMNGTFVEKVPSAFRARGLGIDCGDGITRFQEVFQARHGECRRAHEDYRRQEGGRH
jgi:hypothetical protein